MRKQFILLFPVSLFLIFMFSCSDDSNPTSLVEDNGLTREINELVPDSLFDVLDSLGMPINRGGNPPNVEASYLCKPFKLINSNRESDNIGSIYADYYVKFSNQNNEKLTISMDYENGPEVGNGIGGFIVGDDGKFSVFSKLTVVVYSDTAYILNLISGKLVDNGLQDFYLALLMLDNQGNPNGYYINNGDGRVFKDDDGLAEKIEGFTQLAKEAATKLKTASTVKP
ncbi:MAG TPA: hypothetical protein EYP36_10555 [Calditrichaeota bacterium]|nr:hypothetical protein [Calditrichota bacterium]